MTSLQEKSEWYAESRRTTDPKFLSSLKPIVISKEEGYLIQKNVTKQLGWTVGGWKLGGTNEATRNLFKCNKAYFGPIKEGNIFFAGQLTRDDNLVARGLIGEPELAFRLRRDFSNKDSISSPADALKYFDAFAPAFECPVMGSAQIEYRNLGELVADLCGSGFLVLGKPQLIGRLSESMDYDVIVRQGDKIISKGNSSYIIGSPVNALFEFLHLSQISGFETRPGQWIATGGCAPCASICANSWVSVEFSGLDTFFFY